VTSAKNATRNAKDRIKIRVEEFLEIRGDECSGVVSSQESRSGTAE
jgi:hypothetical protein